VQEPRAGAGPFDATGLGSIQATIAAAYAQCSGISADDPPIADPLLTWCLNEVEETVHSEASDPAVAYEGWAFTGPVGGMVKRIAWTCGKYGSEKYRCFATAVDAVHQLAFCSKDMPRFFSDRINYHMLLNLGMYDIVTRGVVR
jgi:hypothetical protein